MRGRLVLPILLTVSCFAEQGLHMMTGADAHRFCARFDAHWPLPHTTGHLRTPIHSKRVTYSTRMHEPELHMRGRSRAQTCLRGMLSTAPPTRGVLCARLAVCRHCALHILSGRLEEQGAASSDAGAGCFAPRLPVALMYTDWRPATRGALDPRLPFTHVVTRRRNCKLP